MTTRISILLVLAILLAAPASWASQDLNIYLRYAAFDPLTGEPSVPESLKSSPSPNQRGLYIVQFDGPVQEAWKSGVESAGAKLLDYIPQYAFLAEMTPKQAETVRTAEHVRWVGLYHAAYKLDPQLASAGGTVNARIRTHGGGSMERLRKEMGSIGGTFRKAASHARGAQVQVSFAAANAARLARLQEVVWIEPEPEYVLFNDVARGLVSVPHLWSVEGLYGAGEIVAVCDTGLDVGATGPLSADFEGRLLKSYKLGRPADWSDPNGHGTHVSGTILGNGVLSGSSPATRSYSTSYAGAAPEAHLIMQSVMDATGKLSGIPFDLTQLFRPPYRDGARVHNNSWGSPRAGAYTTDSQAVDDFSWSNPDFVMVFAAGNDGTDADSNGITDPDSLSSPGTAKNCITVGASESYRLTGGYQGGYSGFKDADGNIKFNVDPLRSDRVSNNVLGMAAFSARGPTDDGRIKPDVVAPGTNIISARSHLSGAGTLWGAFNTDYCYSGGTSMATPLVSGVSALVREYYRTRRNHSPSAALVKATLINGATDLYPGQYGTAAFIEQPITRPNNVQGWGRIDPVYVLSPTAPRMTEFVDNSTGTGTGGTASYTYSISGNSSPLRIALVWTDYPGSTTAAKALVNDLDLVVIAPDNTVLLGNGAADRTNNVECIDILNPEPGDYIVQVNGFNVPQGPQPYALVVTGAMGPVPPDAAITSPEWGNNLYGPAQIKGTAQGEGFLSYQLEYGAGSEPTTWTPIGTPSTLPVADGVLQIWDTSALPNGEYTIRLTVTGTGGSNSAQITVRVLRTFIGMAKSVQNGTTVTLTGKLVSGVYDLFFYVQEPNGAGGIRVNPVSMPVGLAVGDAVTVTGVLQETDGERAVTGASVLITMPASP